jgi:hypothetical protein
LKKKTSSGSKVNQAIQCSFLRNTLNIGRSQGEQIVHASTKRKHL